MRIGMIMIFLLFTFLNIEPPVSWGGPFTELVNSGEPKIMGIDSMESAIASLRVRTGRPNSIGRIRGAQLLPRKTSSSKKPSLIEMLSDEASNTNIEQEKKSPYVELKPSPDQYVSAEFLPTLPGTTWKYLMNGSDASNVKVLSEVATVRGIETSIAVNENTGVSLCYTSDNDGILIHRELFPKVYIQGFNTVDVIVTFVPPIRLADGLVEVGQTAYSMGTAQYTLLPQKRVIDLDYTATYMLQTRKEVAVPAGSFDALVFKGTLTISGNLESEILYISKGIGLVKNVVEFAGQKRVTELSFANILQ